MADKKPTKLSLKETNINKAVNLFVEPPASDSYYAAEAAVYLKTKLKLSRLEIAQILQMTSAEVLTAFKRYDEGAAKGLIPTGKMPTMIQIEDNAYARIIGEEEEKRSRSQIAKETKILVATSLFEDKLAEAAAKHTPSKEMLKRIEELHKLYKVASPKKLAEEVAFATKSDAHLCLVTENHDLNRALKANETYNQTMMRLVDLHRKNFNVKKQVLNLNGDMLQGTSNYPSQRWDVDRSAADQMSVYVEMASSDINQGLVNFDEVEVIVSPGNHGYVTAKKLSTDPATTNWEILAGRALQWMYQNNKRVKITVPSDWYTIYDVMTNKVLITHGHAISGSGSFDGIVAMVRKWQDVLPPFDYVSLGHFHRCAYLPLPRQHGSSKQRGIHINGAMPDLDDFLQQMGGSPTPQWWFMFFNEKRITAEHKIDLYGG